jgi:SAM-dependent methyltransferase
MAALLDSLHLPNGTDDVLDVGCGAGGMAGELSRRMGPNARYVGFDVHAPSIRWCREFFRDDPRLCFELADVAPPDGLGSAGSAAAPYRFPMQSGGAGFVLAKSLFTHLLEPEARHYLREIGRTLKGGEGRGAVVTAFLFDARSFASERARRVFRHGGERVRWRRFYRPTAAVAYDRSLFEEMVREAGLRVLWTSLHFYPGSDRLRAQDILLLGH